MSCGFVIGAGPGIGAALARRMAREGLDVGLLARRPEALAMLREELQHKGTEVHTQPVDAADPEGLASTLEELVAILGPPDLVVYNAVAWPPGDLLELTPDELTDSLVVNAVGPVVTAQVCAPHLRSGASLIITGGGIVFAPTAAAASLSVGKIASRVVTRLLAESLALLGIHVATVLIAGEVRPGGRFDPDLVAGEMWRLHTQPREAWEHETVWR